MTTGEQIGSDEDLWIAPFVSQPRDTRDLPWIAPRLQLVSEGQSPLSADIVRTTTFAWVPVEHLLKKFD